MYYLYILRCADNSLYTGITVIGQKNTDGSYIAQNINLGINSFERGGEYASSTPIK
jgi:hypothetical protein